MSVIKVDEDIGQGFSDTLYYAFCDRCLNWNVEHDTKRTDTCCAAVGCAILVAGLFFILLLVVSFMVQFLGLGYLRIFSYTALVVGSLLLLLVVILLVLRSLGSVYFGLVHVFRCKDCGASWKSKSLTGDNNEKQMDFVYGPEDIPKDISPFHTSHYGPKASDYDSRGNLVG